MSKISKTGFKGVAKSSRNNNFEAYLYVHQNKNRLKLYIGTFKTPEEAALARIKYIDSLK